MKEIISGTIKKSRVHLPGSKSLTHRFFIAAGLSKGQSSIIAPLMSDDTRLTLSALQCLGTKVNFSEGMVHIRGQNGRFSPYSQPIMLGNSGTSMRLIAGILCMGKGSYLLTGDRRMEERPIQPLIDALNALGIESHSIRSNSCPPVRIKAGSITQKKVSVDCSDSSQFLSSLLMLAPLTENGLHITVKGELVSAPYAQMTLSVMEKFGINHQFSDDFTYMIPGSQSYLPGCHTVEPDVSNASYFWAAGAICRHKIEVLGISANSLQGDIRFLKILHSMGCEVTYSSEGIAVEGKSLKGGVFDMKDMPDLVPTLAVIAAFADGTTRILNVHHLRIKESDRLSALHSELSKMGCSIEMGSDELLIKGSSLHGADIETYNDHRIAMAFAIAGLKINGVRIRNEKCVEKSFPTFWEVLDSLYDSQ